jgi:hypothetical protein
MAFNIYDDLTRIFRSIYINEYVRTNLLPARLALLEAVSTVLRALAGTLAPAYYLCGVDCGGGKSTLIKDILRIWKRLGFKPNGGVIVALHTLEEVAAFATDCGLSPSDYAVFTGEERLNRYGRGRDGVNDAPVLFTTQQMALARMDRYGSFGGITQFHYKGRPRRCRLWDESLEAAPGVVIPLDTLRSLPGKLRRLYPTFVAVLDDLLAAIESIGEANCIIVPGSIKAESGSIVPVISELGLLKEEQEAVRKLAMLAGQTVGVEPGMHGQQALIGAGRSLPADFMPVIVFDASVRLRDGYRLQERYQGNVVRLPGVEHSYVDTAIHLWKAPMGTDKLADPIYRGRILSVAADLINADPDEDWLVIHHKARDGGHDIAAELRALLTDKRQAQFVHWGAHYGSNAYRETRKVIVLGTWRKPDWVYAAMYMASSGRGYEAVTLDGRRQLRQREHDHDLMQAVGRSNIRNVVEGVAGKADVYLLASPEKGLEDRILGTFPGCRLIPWQPIERAATGHLAAAIAYLAPMPVGIVAKQAVRKALGISTASGFRHVTEDKRFVRFLTQAGIMMERYKFVRERAAPV